MSLLDNPLLSIYFYYRQRRQYVYQYPHHKQHTPLISLETDPFYEQAMQQKAPDVISAHAAPSVIMQCR